MQSQTPSQRYHALDSLRAIMMLLGIFIHVACGYATLKDTWWYQDSHTTQFFDYCLLLIHLFRMPVFFVMAGFFAALLYTRRGTVAFLKNRTKRILLPLALGMLTIYPVLRILHRTSRGWRVQRTWDWVAGGGLFRWVEPSHFWFLWYLVLLYALALAVLVIFRRAESSGAERWFRLVVRSQWAPVVFALPTFACLALMPYGVIDTPHSFTPKPLILLLYTIFFGFGWMLYLSQDLLSRLQWHAWWNTAAGIVMMAVNTTVALKQPIPTAATGALAVWLLVFGLTGLFLRYLDRPIPFMRYLSDSAYWMFVFHPIPVLAFNILLSGMAWGPYLKALANLAGTSLILLATYYFCVRSTAVGLLLNGRRYERERLRDTVHPEDESRIRCAAID